MKRLAAAIALSLIIGGGVALLATAPPASAAAKKKSVKKGEKIFLKWCTKNCHTGKKPSFGPEIRGKGKSLAEITKQVRNGGEFMPKFSTEKVGDEDLPLIKAYLDSFAKDAKGKTTRVSSSFR